MQAKSLVYFDFWRNSAVNSIIIQSRRHHDTRQKQLREFLISAAGLNIVGVQPKAPFPIFSIHGHLKIFDSWYPILARERSSNIVDDPTLTRETWWVSSCRKVGHCLFASSGIIPLAAGAFDSGVVCNGRKMPEIFSNFARWTLYCIRNNFWEFVLCFRNGCSGSVILLFSSAKSIWLQLTPLILSMFSHCPPAFSLFA